MSALGTVSVLCDCPSCRVEGALIELVGGSTAGLRLGACRLCGLETIDGAESAAPMQFSQRSQVEAALTRWAAAEGEPDVAMFVHANFTGKRFDEVVSAVMAGERVETSFDVMAWLFRDRTAGQAGLGGAAAADTRETAPSPDDDLAVLAAIVAGAGSPMPVALTPGGQTAHLAAETPPPTQEDRRRTATRALCALALADGTVDEREKTVMKKALAQLEAPAPTDDDWRLWRPNDLPAPDDPVLVLAAMRRVALANRLPDPSEERLIREFARYWGVRLAEPVLPAVTPVQKFVKGWQGWFGR